MNIESNILRYYLRNVYFITGTAYAGKSTAVRLLAERYGLIFCGENYFAEVSDKVAEPTVQPDLCYIRELADFRDFVTRTPEEYERMFTRYNANTRTVTPYGKETYRYFLKYNDRNNIT